MGPSKWGIGQSLVDKRARACAGKQAQDGVLDTAGELSANGPSAQTGGEEGQREEGKGPGAQDLAALRSKGSDNLTQLDKPALHCIDCAHELLLALQKSTGNGPVKNEPERRCVTASRVRGATI